MRASFQIWREGSEAFYVMFNDGNTSVPVQVTSFPMGAALINELMPPVLEAIEASPALGEKLSEVRFLTTTTAQALVTLSYNRPLLDDEWRVAATALQARLWPLAGAGAAAGGSVGGSVGGSGGSEGVVHLVGRSRKGRLVVGGETLEEELRVPGRGLCSYTQTEGAFTQPNAKVCEKMLGWAYEATRGGEDSNLCELYCGNGCFTVAVAPNFRRVVRRHRDVEGFRRARATQPRRQRGQQCARRAADGPRVCRGVRGRAWLRKAERGRHRARGRLEAAARRAARRQGADCAVSDPAPSAGGRCLSADDEAAPWVYDRLRTLLVDPPRAGMDATCRRLAATFDKIVYVSCNPETLARDLAELCLTHAITRVAAFDQFPYTPHLEAGVLLERRKS